ncbi:hypothetical protein PDO_4784 [Rhizobium sp. PDO1-076]|uniref:PepSY domain-containing protein n=1 Tax=Rhizobium sp. PDO1-076 TaxID=1125979 RepID=UPI00024E2CE1|nr:hypothetical protein [Rhizobium sp. PDO1-076]EHS52312.1 hypothetical protein PDO_4784 [Rhizobium sp. PDO1-076]
MDRRTFLNLLLSLPTALTVLARTEPAWADDDSDSDSDSDNDSDSSGRGSGGSDDSGDDSDNSGHGNSDDRDDDGNEDDDDNTGSGSGSKGRDRDADHVRARDAVRQGRILSLRQILDKVDEMKAGRVISVDLNLEARTPYYALKVESAKGSVRSLRLNAETGRKLSAFGW